MGPWDYYITLYCKKGTTIQHNKLGRGGPYIDENIKFEYKVNRTSHGQFKCHLIDDAQLFNPFAEFNLSFYILKQSTHFIFPRMKVLMYHVLKFWIYHILYTIWLVKQNYHWISQKNESILFSSKHKAAKIPNLNFEFYGRIKFNET